MAEFNVNGFIAIIRDDAITRKILGSDAHEQAGMERTYVLVNVT
jgi:hypothetical protein